MNNIIKRIGEAKHVVVIAHLNPDADSIGSASALYTYLLTLHKKVSFFCASNISQKLSFIPWADKIRNSFPSSADLAISLDCGDIDRLGVEIDCDLINIDHHVSNTKYGKYNLVDTSAISTASIVFDFFKYNKIPINQKIATALYAGILEDSNGFVSDTVDGMVFATAGELIDSGADYKICNKYIKKYESLSALRLKAIMLLNMSLVKDAKVALFLVTQEDMKKSGADAADCEIALEDSLCLPTVEVSVLLKENKDFTIKCSLRSNSDIDVSKIASVFSGGGHKIRAGFLVKEKLSLEELSKKVIKLIDKEI